MVSFAEPAQNTFETSRHVQGQESIVENVKVFTSVVEKKKDLTFVMNVSRSHAAGLKNSQFHGLKLDKT